MTGIREAGRETQEAKRKEHRAGFIDTTTHTYTAHTYSTRPVEGQWPLQHSWELKPFREMLYVLIRVENIGQSVCGHFKASSDFWVAPSKENHIETQCIMGHSWCIEHLILFVTGTNIIITCWTQTVFSLVFSLINTYCHICINACWLWAQCYHSNTV